MDEVLQFEFGVVNRKTRLALLRERSIARLQPASLRTQLDTLRTLLAVSADDFSCCLCVCDARETGALLELGTRELAVRVADVRQALPAGTDAGKIVAASPSLLLQEQAGARVRAALETLREAGADPAALALERPGSFGGVLAKLCSTDSSVQQLAPFLRAWVMDRK